MKQPRIVIAAPASGTGKTTVTCALLEALCRRPMDVCSFKCGPDYIDPLYHRRVIGIPSGNLDLFFTDEVKTKFLFNQEFRGSLAVIEGVMGLYDGLGGIREEASTYHLARTLNAPVILVVDARGVGRSVLAQIRGMLDYDRDNLIRGVILNRVSASFGPTLASLIEEELGIEVLGFLPNRKGQALQSRHLGLVLPGEVPALRENLGEFAAELEAHVNVNRIVEIAESAGELEFTEDASIPEISECASARRFDSVRIAVARDEAFCFYYRENLELLRTLGAEIIYFSPLRDRALPENIDGMLLGGGYPELHLAELSRNEGLKESIRQAADSGLPIRAECGGFMYLGAGIAAEALASMPMTPEAQARTGTESESERAEQAGESGVPEGTEGENASKDSKESRIYPMVGLHPGVFVRKGMTSRFGYITLTSKATGRQIRAHEFHYYDCVDGGDCGSGYRAEKPIGGKCWDCMVEQGNILMGFPHLYYPSNPDYAKEFVRQCRDWKRSK